MKPKRQRLWFIIFGMAMLGIATTLIMMSFRDNLVFFYSPSDLVEKRPSASQFIRIGGLVEQGSIIHPSENSLSFVVTDGSNSLAIYYEGLPPALFREGQGIVAEGHLESPKRFVASRILAKHDENYMPPEVADAIKKQGVWRSGKP